MRPGSLNRTVSALFSALSSLSATGTGNVAGGLAAVGSSVSRHGLVVVLSDLYGDEALLLRAVASIRRVAEVAVVQILAPAEREIPSGFRSLQELEGGTVVSLDGAALGAYGARIGAWPDRLRSGVRSAGAEWVSADAAEPPVNILTRWLRRVS